MSRIAVATWSNQDFVDPEAAEVTRELCRRGHDSATLPWDGDFDHLGWGDYDLVVVRSTWDYFQRLEQFLGWVERLAAVTRVVNSPKVIGWNVHKGYLQQMAAAGIPVLPSLALTQGAPDPVGQLLAAGWAEVVIKPAVDGGALGAVRALATDPSAAYHLCALVAAGDAIVQPYAPEVQQGETSLFFFGGSFSHAVRKLPKPGDYRVQAMHGGSEHAHQPSAAEFDSACRAMSLAPDRLTYARADFLEVDGVPQLMELECIEPDIFLRMAPGALERFCDAVESELA